MKFLIYGFLLAGAIFLANMFYGPIIKNHMLEGKMINLVNESRLKDDFYLMRDLMSFVEENNIPVKQEQFVLQRPQPKEVILDATYKVDCKFYFLEKHYVFKPTTRNESAHGLLPDFAAY
ncbi:MAG TPA: hypothetical protein VF720_07080 [Candidatus Eisenbacteria bacterium]